MFLLVAPRRIKEGIKGFYVSLVNLDQGRGDQAVWYWRQQHVPPGQGVTHCELREDEAALRVSGRHNDAAIAGVAVRPAGPPAVGKVAEGKVSGAGERERSGRVAVRRVGRHEAGVEPGDEESEELRRVDGAVPAEEGGVGDEAAEGFARGRRADEVGGGVEPDEELLQEVVGEDPLHRRQSARALD